MPDPDAPTGSPADASLPSNPPPFAGGASPADAVGAPVGAPAGAPAVAAEVDRLAPRVAALESEVAGLHRELAALRAEVARSAARPAGAARPVRRVSLPAFDAEALVGRAGVAILLVGLVFLLRWGAEQGWLTPPMRVGAVALLGGGLLAAGVALRAREAFGALLSGGGLAALYGALFAAFQLYALVGAGAGLGLAAGLTGGAFALALRTRAPILAVVGVLGAVGAPALMYRDAGGLWPTALFLSVALAGGGALWWRTGWRTLLVALTLGGWAALTAVRLKARGLPGDDPAAVLVAAVVAFAATAVLALARPARPDGDEAIPGLPSLAQPRALAVWLGPVAFALLAVSALRASGPVAAVAMLAVAGLAQAAARRWPGRVEALGLATGVLVVGAAWHGLGARSDALVAGVAVAAAALTGAEARRRGDASLPRLATAALAVAAVVLAGLTGLVDAPRAWTLGALGVALAGIGGALARSPAMGPQTRRVHVLAGHVLALVAAHVAFAALPGGRALVAGAWGLYAAALIVAGLRTGRDDVRWLGLGTLVATVARVLVLDLAGVSMAARVLLFVGLGLVLLGVAYLAPRLGRAPKNPAPKDRSLKDRSLQDHG